MRCDDGDEAHIGVYNENWRFASSSVAGVLTTKLPSPKRNAQNAFALYLDTFGHKAFLRHRPQLLQSYVLHTAYDREEHSFKVDVTVISRSELPSGAGLIHSSVVYKGRVEGDASVKTKACIAPHGNEDLIKESLRSDCASCVTTGVRMLLSVCVMRDWNLVKVDAKAAFLQTGAAWRAVYIIPPFECDYKRRFVGYCKLPPMDLRSPKKNGNPNQMTGSSIVVSHVSP